MVKHAWLAAVVAVLAGCTGKSDEAEAYQELKPKPMTEEQKQMIDKVKGSSPQPAGLHPNGK